MNVPNTEIFSYRVLSRRFIGINVYIYIYIYINVENLRVSNAVYHKQCYNEVTNVTKIKRLKRNPEEVEEGSRRG